MRFRVVSPFYGRISRRKRIQLCRTDWARAGWALSVWASRWASLSLEGLGTGNRGLRPSECWVSNGMGVGGVRGKVGIIWAQVTQLQANVQQCDQFQLPPPLSPGCRVRLFLHWTGMGLGLQMGPEGH